LESINNLNPKVVILDIQMPAGNGIETLKAINRGITHQRDHSANHPQREYQEKCLELGAKYFLDKTRDFDKLIEICKGFVERFRAEEKLNEMEERYRVVAETATDVIITIDEQSTILFVNKSVERVFGYTVPELLGQPIARLFPPACETRTRLG